MLQQWLERKKGALKEQWASGGLSHPINETTIAANHAAIGAYNAFEEVRELDFLAFIGEFDDGEQKRVGSFGTSSTN